MECINTGMVGLLACDLRSAADRFHFHPLDMLLTITTIVIGDSIAATVMTFHNRRQ